MPDRNRNHTSTTATTRSRQIVTPISHQCRLWPGDGIGSVEEVASFTGSFTNGKRWVVRHDSSGHLIAHRQTHENLGRDAFHSQGRVVVEAKTPIEGGIAHQDAALNPYAPNCLQTFIDECLTNSLSLIAWQDRNRPECKPPAILSVD